MKKLIKSKRNVILLIIILLALIAGIFVNRIFWNSSYTSPEYKFSVQLFDKIMKAQSEGSTAELTKDEVNQIVALYFKEYRKGDVTVKSVEAELEDDSIRFYAPVSYKGINLFLWSQGGISLENSKIKYTPDYFKAGKVTLPKSYILKKLSQKLKNGAAVEGGSIVVNIKELPIGITAVSVKNGKLLVTLEKRKFNIEDMLKGKLSSIKNFIGNSSSIKESNSSTKINNGSNVSKANENGTEKANNGISTANSVSGEKQQVLSKVISGLNAASASVSTGAQKAVILQMISVVSNMSDPSYNPYSEESSVKAAYKQLSQTEKAGLKAAVFSNVDTSQVSVLANMIGN
ncbi:DUF2140 domain-containing protein [Clostridium sp. WILCCON 0269]|uniref:DUF2140 domain-containing protein n=1 Tax=Candidatus Clostridium eludens TaxID=3381663 RepID=A0ABW8SHG0_9CLOT